MAEKKAASAMPEANRTVRIKLPILYGGSKSEDVYVSVNNKEYLIKRGVEVDVPVAVAKILKNQEIMLKRNYDFISANAAK